MKKKVDFKKYWNIIQKGEVDEKLTKEELLDLQDIVYDLQQKHKPASAIITYLQNWNQKLADRYKAERAFVTEMKRVDTSMVMEDAKQEGVNKFKCLISPNACKICRQKTENGNRIFDSATLNKSGEGHKPPFHPNCYCVIVPHVD
jgi:hypothetical protein